jgi:hypothetical protein
MDYPSSSTRKDPVLEMHPEPPEIDIGMEARDLVLALPRLFNRKVRALTFITYRPSPGIEQRIEQKIPPKKRQKLNQLLLRARKSLRVAEPQFRYWKSSILTGTWMTLDFAGFIDDGLKHFPPRRGPKIRIPVDVGMRSKLALIKAEADRQDHVVAICSRSSCLNGLPVHIPMMDFKCKPNRKNLALVLEALYQIGEKRGVILKSGDSFHYFGLDLLTHSKWVRFLAGCALVAPLTDSRYIAHRLADGVAVLRITKSTQKQETPHVVAIFGMKKAGA